MVRKAKRSAVEFKKMPLSDVLLMNDSGKEQTKKWMLILLKEQMCNTSEMNIRGMILCPQAQHRLVGKKKSRMQEGNMKDFGCLLLSAV